LSRGALFTAMLLALLVTLMTAAPDASAQPAADEALPQPAEAPVSRETLESRIAEVEASSTENPETTATLLELYRRTLADLQRADTARGQAAAFENAVPDARTEIARITEALDTPPPAPDGPGADLPMSTLEQRLSETRSDLATAEAELRRLRDQVATETARPAAARTRLAEARSEQSDTVAELNEQTPTGEAAETTQARRWNLQTRGYALAAEIASLEQELLSHSIRMELLEARLELAEREANRLKAVASALESAIGARREADAAQAREQAEAERQALAGRNPLVSELAERNVELSDRLARTVLEVQRTTEARNAAQEQSKRIAEDLRATRTKLEVAGLGQALGQLLFEQRRSLPDLQRLRRDARDQQRLAARLGLDRIRLLEERRQLRDLPSYVDALVRGLSGEQADRIRPELRRLCERRRDLLAQTVDAGAEYLRVLGELTLEQRQLINAVDAYEEFLQSRLLWARNTTPVQLDALASIGEDVRRLLPLDVWASMPGTIVRTLRADPLLTTVLLVLLALGLARRRCIRALHATAPIVRRISTDNLWYSVKALALTALIAAPLPLALMVIALAMRGQAPIGGFEHAIASGLWLVAVDLLILRFFIETTRELGLAAAHCRWSDHTVHKLRRELGWFQLVFPPLRFIAEASVRLDGTTSLSGLSIVTTALAALVLGVLLYRLFTPSGGVLRDHLVAYPDGLLARTRALWLTGLLTAIAALLVLWSAGFLNTADALAKSYMLSLWVALSLMVVQSLFARSLLRGYQRLKLQALRTRRDAERAARAAAGEQDERAATLEDAIALEEMELDIESLDASRQTLLRNVMLFAMLFSLSLIWSPILPALGFLENVALWSRTGIVDGVSVSIPVTLADLIIVVIITAATTMAARGLPAFVEFILVQRQVSPGVRYTVATLLRYAIVGTGAIVVFAMLGASWSQIQWLVAALGVGIGFGLQEIVANFISGLIILFERPIRVGDVVTVADTSGVVTRIQIRATTIRDWDRRELLVPNREFITGRLLNWTLSDTTVRVSVEVGVAYRSDVVEAMRLIELSARENEHVLEEPAPFVTLSEFADNALKLTLRVYLPSLDYFLTAVSDLRVTIFEKLKAADIVIAFPQRDVHLDAGHPINVRLEPAAAVPSAGVDRG
jgi:potassium efflux system protein